MTKIQQQDYCTSHKNEETNDKNTEQNVFLKLIWHSATFKTFTNLKKIYTIENWALFQVFFVLSEITFLLITDNYASEDIDILTFFIVSMIIYIVCSALVAFITSKIYKDVGFYKCCLIMNYSFVPVLIMNIVLIIYGNLLKIDVAGITDKISLNIFLHPKETIYTYLGLISVSLFIYCLFFYLRRNMEAACKQ